MLNFVEPKMQNMPYKGIIFVFWVVKIMYLWSENNETTNQKWVVIEIAFKNIVSLALMVFAQNSKIALLGNPSRQISI